MHLLLIEIHNKNIFTVHGAWNSPNTLPFMVHGQGFLIITRQPQLRRVVIVRFVNISGIVNHHFCIIFLIKTSLMSYDITGI